jgi:hypothetical protein
MFQPLLTLIPCPLNRAACRLIAAADPACDTSFWWIAPYVRINGCEKGIVRVFEGRRGQDLGELLGELFLIEVSEEKERESFLVHCPFGIANGPFYGCIQGLHVYAWVSRCAGLLAEVCLEGRKVGQCARGESWRRRDTHLIRPYCACHDGSVDAPWWRSMRSDVRVASWSRSGKDARAEGGDEGRATDSDGETCAIVEIDMLSRRNDWNRASMAERCSGSRAGCGLMGRLAGMESVRSGLGVLRS